jgi:hypothetical protein
MSDEKRIEQEPLYPCCNCYDEYSWNKKDLRWYKNELWCANCFDELDDDGGRMWWADLEPFIPKADRELADARAEIERLKKDQQLASAINCAMQEANIHPDDYTGHECLAKHKLLSLYDLWRKKVKPRLPGFINDEIYRRDKLIEQMREALIWGCNVCPEVNDYGDKRHCKECRVNELLHNAALLAAERGE